VKETWDQKVRLFEKFLRDNLIRLLIHIGVFIILSLFFTSLRKHIHEWTDIDDSVKASAHILSRPLSVALVIVMIVRLWIYPNNPLIVSEISRLILVIPLLRLLPGLAPPEFRRPIYGLGWLYILQLLGEILPDGSLAERLVVLLLTLLALAGMMWIVRPGGIIQTLRVNRWFLFIKTYFQLSALLFAVSIVSNIFGNLSLASLLAAGTFLSLYTFVILVMVVLVLDGLIFLLLKSRAAQSLRMVRMHNAMWNKGSRRLIRFAALFLWLSISLKALGILDPVRRGFTQILQKQLAVGTLKISLEDILAFLVTLVVSVYLAKIIRFVLNEDILPRFPLPRGVPNAISFVAYYFILFAGFIIALGAAGIEWSRFAILAGALGVGIGFGLQNLVNNFVSGLILIFERPVKVGDLIEFAGQRGEVLRIGIRSSTVRTWEGSEIIVPNGNLISSEVINWTLSDRKRRLKIYVGVAYGSDPDVVLGILNKAADEHPEVIKNPAPLATFKGFGESSLDFELRFSIREFLDWIRVQSDLYLTILRELNAAGIEIPFPQHDLHLRSLNPEVKEHLNKEKSKTKVL
jgi:small-conductance mechanosensitive channel